VTDVVLVNWRNDSPRVSLRLEHLGLAYLSSFLENSGYTVSLFDDSFLNWNEEELAGKIIAQKPKIVGFSLFVNNTRPVLQFIKQLRLRGLTSHITLGGHHATFNCGEILKDNPGVDSVVRGEGEEALAALAGRIRSGQSWHTLANLAYLDETGKEVLNPCRTLLKDLDALPFPSRKAYAQFVGTTKIAALVSGRGCYANCSFCSIRAFYRLSPGKTWRWRSPANVVDEIEAVVRDYGVTSIIFLDDNFLGLGSKGRKRAQAIAAELIKRKLTIKWHIACRSTDIDLDTLKILQEAGLMRVDLGVESWVPRQLALYNKGITVEENERAIAILQKLKMDYALFLIPLDPYITKAELLENFNAVEKFGIEHFFEGSVMHRLELFRGTKIQQRLQADGLLRSSGNLSYMEFLDYEFQSPEMRQIYPFLLDIGKAFSRLQEKVNKIFSNKPLNSEELEFNKNLKLAISRTFLAQLRFLLNCRNPKKEVPAIMVQLGEVHNIIDQIVLAWNEGAFKRFQPCRYVIGREVIEFPRPNLQSLCQSLMSSLLEYSD
jgi:radical SAM superfamily enzyme YgiQ (UPF0313 family)